MHLNHVTPHSPNLLSLQPRPTMIALHSLHFTSLHLTLLHLTALATANVLRTLNDLMKSTRQISTLRDYIREPRIARRKSRTEDYDAFYKAEREKRDNHIITILRCGIRVYRSCAPHDRHHTHCVTSPPSSSNLKQKIDFLVNCINRCQSIARIRNLEIAYFSFEKILPTEKSEW